MTFTNYIMGIMLIRPDKQEVTNRLEALVIPSQSFQEMGDEGACYIYSSVVRGMLKSPSRGNTNYTSFTIYHEEGYTMPGRPVWILKMLFSTASDSFMAHVPSEVIGCWILRTAKWKRALEQVQAVM